MEEKNFIFYEIVMFFLSSFALHIFFCLIFLFSRAMLRLLLNHIRFRRGMTGLPSSRLLKGRGSVVPGDDTIADTESVDGGGEESEK
jgi:hypothetical protein